MFKAKATECVLQMSSTTSIQSSEPYHCVKLFAFLLSNSFHLSKAWRGKAIRLSTRNTVDKFVVSVNHPLVNEYVVIEFGETRTVLQSAMIAATSCSDIFTVYWRLSIPCMQLAANNGQLIVLPHYAMQTAVLI